MIFDRELCFVYEDMTATGVKGCRPCGTMSPVYRVHLSQIKRIRRTVQ